MTKPQWRTLSIRVAAHKAVAIQTRFPLKPEEWDKLLATLEEMKPGLVEEPEASHV